jgi:oxygen-independent coproporphyrinogen-3 oxidase
MQLDLANDHAATEVGSYFVANYPPFSAWRSEHVPTALEALDAASTAARAEARGSPIGLYIHIPFCRKRCKFCYFRVYTDKKADEVEVYLEALARETALYADRPALEGRSWDFVYFGGGTPSFLSSEQLHRLIDRIREHWAWDDAREVTFECEPGTLKKSKLAAIKEIGTTRLSLGVEHFDDEVLSLGGRAHKSPEIFQAYEWAREVGFPEINIDLIAGMVGDTQAKWEDAVEKALQLKPDCLTVYQMEVPYNTTLAREAKETGRPTPVPDWATKRRWVDHAFTQFERAGYVVSSATTVYKPDDHKGFFYRDALWHGSDMIGMGVASFSHLSGVHFQNVDSWEQYVEALSRNELPLARALPLTDRQRLTRELILQLKLGKLDARYFRGKFGVEIIEEFDEAFRSLVREGLAELDGDHVRLTRPGLLCVDSFLPRFFEPEFRNVRYT